MFLELLVATRNRGKIAEISTLLANLPIRVRTLDEFPDVPPVSENGSTYQENATLKAQSYARLTGLWAIADDSGLEVDVLAGAPGVLSARYAGYAASDQERVSLLLDEMGHAGSRNRSARFCCVVAIAEPSGKVIRIESGACEGSIRTSPRGSEGFGYDPIFVPEGFTATFAELGTHTKNAISHRGKALGAARDFLNQMIAQQMIAQLDHC